MITEMNFTPQDNDHAILESKIVVAIKNAFNQCHERGLLMPCCDSMQQHLITPYFPTILIDCLHCGYRAILSPFFALDEEGNVQPEGTIDLLPVVLAWNKSPSLSQIQVSKALNTVYELMEKTVNPCKICGLKPTIADQWKNNYNNPAFRHPWQYETYHSIKIECPNSNRCHPIAKSAFYYTFERVSFSDLFGFIRLIADHWNENHGGLPHVE